MVKEHLVVIEATPWDGLLLRSMEIAVAHAHLGQPVEYFFLEDAATERRRIKSWIRRVEPLARVLSARPERLLLEQMKAYVANNGLPVNIQVVRRRDWAERTESVRNDRFEDIRSLKLDGREAGKYILSSLITQTKNPYPSPKRHSRALQYSAQKFRNIAKFSHDTLVGLMPDKVLVFNGRFLENGAVIEVCKELDIPVSFYGRGGLLGERIFYEDFPIHDRLKSGVTAKQEWEAMTERERADSAAVAAEFLEKARGKGGLGLHRSPRTKKIPLPPKANRKAKKVVFFTSTELEYVPVGIISSSVGFPDQFEAIIELSRACRELSWDLVIRVHPNVSNSGRHERKRWDRKLAQHLVRGRVLGSRSGVDSYQLLEDADLVAVWHSTIGVEAVFRGIPVLCMTETAYSHAGSDVKVVALEDNLVDNLRQTIANRPQRDSVLCYVHYFLTFGVSFQHLSPDSLSHSRFMNPLARFTWSRAKKL